MTMREVAELAGVSVAAVSRYLNGGYISGDKAARIQDAIDKTGYVRSNQARSLRTGSTRLVGVVVPKINSESISRLTAGVSEALQAAGYQMLLANTANDPACEIEYLELLQRYPVERHHLGRYGYHTCPRAVLHRREHACGCNRSVCRGLQLCLFR